MVKFLLPLVALFLAHSSCRAELMVVSIEIVLEPQSGWNYVVEDDRHILKTDEELGKYLKGLSNPRDSILLTIESKHYVPVGQLLKILSLVKANPQGIQVERIDLGTRRFNIPRSK